MATNELILSANRQNALTINKILGITAMIGAPLLLVEGILKFFTSGTYDSPSMPGATLEFSYIFGWICAAIGIRRARITGTGKGAAILFYIQMTGLILAILLNTQDLLQIKPEQSGVFYNITDIAYPFSHVLMTAVGIFIIRAKVWHGMSVIAPFLIGLALPVFFAASAVISFERSFFIFPILTTTGFFIIGYSLFQHKTVE